MPIPSPGLGAATCCFCLQCFLDHRTRVGDGRLGPSGLIPENLAVTRVFRAFGAATLLISAVALLPPMFGPLIPSRSQPFFVAVWTTIRTSRLYRRLDASIRSESRKRRVPHD